MTYVAVGVLVLIIAGQGALMLRMLAHHELQINVLRSAHPDLTTMTELVADLCQRIQAPAVAVAQHAAYTTPTVVPQHVPMDDDDAHWASKEELAEILNGVG